MVATMAHMPARTLDEWRAKARIVRLFANLPAIDGTVDAFGDQTMAWSLACDLLGEPSHAIAPAPATEGNTA